MARLNYFIAFEDYAAASLSEFAEVIEKIHRKRVGLLTIEELCSISEYPNGIYLLFDDNNNLWYVGKATSRSFIERIPAHFDPREDAWFNSIPKSIMKKNNMNYSDALQKGLTLEIALIGVKEKTTASKLETVLRSYLKPRLNTCKGNFQPEDKLDLITGAKS